VLVELVERHQALRLEELVMIQFLIQLHPQVVEAEDQMQALQKENLEDQAAAAPGRPLARVEQEMIQ
jgi:hypothetical protein|tara:strand:- start:72 stop:272 length:201 start_codon:yes stop_codon:yes gene_type:complete